MQKKIILVIFVSLLLSMLGPISLVTSQQSSHENVNNPMNQNNEQYFDFISRFDYELYIELSEGENYISFNVEPENMSMLNIVQPLINEGSFVMVKDGNSGVLWPEYGIDTIGDMQVTKGYTLQVNQDTSLTVEGTLVELPLDISLQQGWNLIGYPVYEPRDALEVINFLIGQGVLETVLDEDGLKIYYDGSQWVNEIGYFTAGNAYYVKVNAQITFEISLPDDPTIPIIDGSSTGYVGEEIEFTIGGSDYQGYGDMYYNITWDDGYDSCIGPLPAGELINVSHIWHDEGEYNISLFAEASTGQQSQSVYHQILIEVMVEYPTKPFVTGPSQAGSNIVLNFSAVSEDAYADEIYYQWDFGDGNITDWLGPYEPGIPMITNYSWFENGEYQIQVNAKNSNNEESGWSTPYNITIAQQISITNLELGFIYINVFDNDNPYGYIIFLDLIRATIMLTREKNLVIETSTSDHVHSVKFQANDLMYFDNFTFFDDNASNGFQAVIELPTGLYELSVSAYDEDGIIIDKYQIDFFVNVIISRNSKALQFVTEIREKLLNATS
jgi:hypothetical protein